MLSAIPDARGFKQLMLIDFIDQKNIQNQNCEPDQTINQTQHSKTQQTACRENDSQCVAAPTPVTVSSDGLAENVSRRAIDRYFRRPHYLAVQQLPGRHHTRGKLLRHLLLHRTKYKMPWDSSTGKDCAEGNKSSSGGATTKAPS